MKNHLEIKKEAFLDRKRDLALMGMLGNGISGWMNNITDQEKRESNLFLDSPNQFPYLFLDERRIINCPLLASRIKRIVAKRGIEALDVINELLWGIVEDGKNTPLEFARARDFFETLKGGD